MKSHKKINSTSKKPQFSQASFMISMVGAFSSVLRFFMSTTGNFSICFLSSVFLSLTLIGSDYRTICCESVKSGVVWVQFIGLWLQGECLGKKYILFNLKK